MVRDISDMTAIDGRQFSYNCTYENGNPEKTRVNWTRLYDMSVWGDAHLLLTSVNRLTDEGEYRCTVGNIMLATGLSAQLGLSYSSFYLTVNCKFL